jgi:putative ABC transport system permease protein
MHYLEGILIALEALWANKLRTILTLLGNIVGVMSVIAIVSIIDGTNSYIEDEVASEGTGVFRVTRQNPLDILTDFDKFLEARHNPRMTLYDLEYLRERVTLAEYINGSLGTGAEVRYRRRHIESVGVEGKLEYYPLMGKYDLQDGRHFSVHEIEHRTAVAVIGFDVADRLYPGIDPIGKDIRIGGSKFRVIGVLEELPETLGGNPNLRVVIPLTAHQKTFGFRRSIEISVKPASLDDIQPCIDQTRLVMRGLRKLGPKRDDNFAIVTSDNLLSLWEGISQSIFAVLVGIVSISLVVGGIVIMNIMLVSVTERTREIGVRKALGATRANILWQFLVEAITMSSCGGVLGILFGFAIASAIAYFTPLPYAIKIWSIFVGMGVTFAVGVFFGAYPAVQASKLDPIEALRYE